MFNSDYTYLSVIYAHSYRCLYKLVTFLHLLAPNVLQHVFLDWDFPPSDIRMGLIGVSNILYVKFSFWKFQIQTQYLLYVTSSCSTCLDLSAKTSPDFRNISKLQYQKFQNLTIQSMHTKYMWWKFDLILMLFIF